MTITRRGLLVGGTAGAAVALGGVAAPALAADDVWNNAFFTHIENRQGFDVNAMTADQTRNARFIIALAAGYGISEYGTKIALATAITEAWLNNYGPQVDHTSGGLFQQQTATGWGTYDQVRNKLLATQAFLGVATHTRNPGLLTLGRDYKKMAFGAAAQAVQRSAYPERYDQARPAAEALWKRHADSVKPFHP